jgi:hypothetical protein
VPIIVVNTQRENEMAKCSLTADPGWEHSVKLDASILDLKFLAEKNTVNTVFRT